MIKGELVSLLGPTLILAIITILVMLLYLKRIVLLSLMN